MVRWLFVGLVLVVACVGNDSGGTGSSDSDAGGGGASGSGDGDIDPTGDGDVDGCEVGSAACPCTSGGGCDPSLTCLSDVCVDATTLGDGDSDGGTLGPTAVTEVCGSTTCRASVEEVKWGAEICCLDSEPVCGLKSDAPNIITPDLDVIPEMIIPVPEAVQMIEDNGGEHAVNPDATIDCMAKDQPGNPSADCPTWVLHLNDSTGGADGDAGMMSNANEIVFVGCCQPDGACGYLDDNTGFGCVKITDSLVGRLYGHVDVTCGS